MYELWIYNTDKKDDLADTGDIDTIYSYTSKKDCLADFQKYDKENTIYMEIWKGNKFVLDNSNKD